MTAATLRKSMLGHRLEWALGALLLAILAAVALVELRAGEARAQASVSLIPASKAAALVRATSGPAAVAVKAVGDEARLINAAIPFDKAPVGAARPFDMTGDSGLDHRRALLCMTQAVYYEAGFEPIDGRRAVAQVVLNRMRHPAFPKSVCGVVYQGSRQPVCQFSFVCDGSLYRRPGAAAWREAERVAAAALSGYVETSVGSATHYHADYVAPYWAPMLSKVAKLGAHIFYRWPGAWGRSAAFTGRYIGEPNDPLSLRPPLRPATVVNAEGELVEAVPAGPPIPRAPNDVGGLLDISKGWTLNIPGPSDSSSAAKSISDRQIAQAAASVVAEAKAPSPPALASR